MTDKLKSGQYAVSSYVGGIILRMTSVPRSLPNCIQQ